MLYRVLAYVALAGFVAGGLAGANVPAYSDAGWTLYAVSFVYLLGYAAFGDPERY